MNWSFLTSKVFWLNVIVVVVAGVQYAVTNNMFPGWVIALGGVIVVLDTIKDAIQTTKVAGLKRTIAGMQKPVSK